jgi:hypothetical protein
MIEANTVHSVHLDDGVRSAFIVAVGPKFTSMIWIDDRNPGVRINKLLNTEIRAIELAGYPIAKAKKLFRKSGRSLGITKSAKRALRA